MLTLITTFAYIVIGCLLHFVLEPWLRLRKGILLAKEPMDREMIRTMGSIFWPLALIIYPLLRFIVFPFFTFLGKLSDQSDEFWKPKQKVKSEPIVDEAKSGYRNIEMKEQGE